jgi:Domain of unknown function (DUF5658)
VSAVTLLKDLSLRAGKYNVRNAAPSAAHNKNGPGLKEQPPAGMNSETRERRGSDRRQRVARALVQGSFKPRRCVPRRFDEQTLTAVDWHHPHWLAIATLIVLSCCADAFLTLLLLGRGASEVNPLMAPLVGGSSLTFAVVKIGITAAGVVLLTQVARIRAFGRIPVGVILYCVLALYCALIVYELRLLGA